MGNEIEARIAVVGIGGAGCNVVNEVFFDYPEADSVAIDTDRKKLSSVHADSKIHVSQSITAVRGNIENGFLQKQCGDAIVNALKNHDVVYIVSGLGGRTGTFLSSYIAKAASSLGCIVSSILIKPCPSDRTKIDATESINLLSGYSATVVVDNSKIYGLANVSSTEEAYAAVNGSIVSYIVKQQEKIMSEFVEQIETIAVPAPVAVPLK